jgi:hypothetical protein
MAEVKPSTSRYNIWINKTMKLHRKHLIKQRRENEIPLKLGFSMDLKFTNL